MEAAEDLVHGIDREADSAARHRQWLARWHLFLVRADFTRQVVFREASPGLHVKSPSFTNSHAACGTGAIGGFGTCLRSLARCTGCSTTTKNVAV